MKIITWNVNSIRTRLDQIINIIQDDKPDILCLQETKVQDHEFPKQSFIDLGYNVIFFGQRKYNGVCIISKHKISNVNYGNKYFNDDQKRIISCTINEIRFINVYVPNGEAVGSEKYIYKIDWLKSIIKLVSEELVLNMKLVLAGDFNIAPKDEDVFDPIKWKDKILCSFEERELFSKLIKNGLYDIFIEKNKSIEFTWWDYRMNSFKRNLGLRIDHFLISNELRKKTDKIYVDKKIREADRPSDHAPVVLNLND